MKKQVDIYRELDRSNANQDPWETKHPYNQKTFNDLISLIKLVPHKSILEVGCAQGNFTNELRKISNDVTAIDVSKSAIDKAQKSVKGVKFYVSSLENFYPKRRYDVVICAEVLYYIKDSKSVIKKLQALGDYLVVSQYVFCLPEFSFGTLKYEWALHKLPLIKRKFATYQWPLTLTIRSLRKLKY